MYDVIAEPPVFVGGVQVTVTVVSPPVTPMLVGAPGVVKVDAGVDEAEEADGPMTFRATTVKEYSVARESPETTQVFAGV
jgi:hypothetical protein